MRAPILVTTWPFGDAGHRAAWPELLAGGSSLDAVEAVCRHAEDDPSVDSVGFGGRPDRDGEVTLDALVMQSPARVGAVCALRHTIQAVSVARAVLERSPHVLLAGSGADAFAAECGFARDEMLLPAAREAWEAWRAAGAPDGLAGHDTVCSLGIDADGVLSGASSSSGRAWKAPGRVGDSPLPGHGLYVDPRHGAAAATGDGELVQGLCTTFAVVEAIGRGMAPLDALRDALVRLRDAHSLDPERCNDEDVQIGLTVLTPDGAFATAALRPGYQTSVCCAEGRRVVDPDFLLFE